MAPYYTLSDYFQKIYHKKIYKIAIDAGFTCPNRDGSLDTRGCIFCSAGGSGDFAIQRDSYPSISEQIAQGLLLFGSKNVGDTFVAYFQAYTNTYAPVSYLEKIYREALQHEKIAGISIATRPDCLGDDVLALLERLQAAFPDKFIWIELGLQTIHEAAATYIRRGYPLSVFDKAIEDLHQIHIPVIVHVILGLPGEAKADMIETVNYLNNKHIFGIKLQLLHIIEGTDLAYDYKNHAFDVLTLDAYIDILIDCIEVLSSDIVIHRVTGDGPKDLLLAPLWSRNKRNVLNTLQQQMARKGAFQGRNFHESGSIDTL